MKKPYKLPRDLRKTWNLSDLFEIPQPGHHRYLQELTPRLMVTSAKRRQTNDRRKQGAKARCKA